MPNFQEEVLRHLSDKDLVDVIRATLVTISQMRNEAMRRGIWEKLKAEYDGQPHRQG